MSESTTTFSLDHLSPLATAVTSATALPPAGATTLTLVKPALPRKPRAPDVRYLSAARRDERLQAHREQLALYQRAKWAYHQRYTAYNAERARRYDASARAARAARKAALRPPQAVPLPPIHAPALVPAPPMPPSLLRVVRDIWRRTGWLTTRKLASVLQTVGGTRHNPWFDALEDDLRHNPERLSASLLSRARRTVADERRAKGYTAFKSSGRKRRPHKR